jgi:uncharacterized protein (DUF1501 family)
MMRWAKHTGKVHCACRADRRTRQRDAAGRQWRPPPNSFPAQAARLARLIGQDDHIRLAFASLGGWDTHVNEGNHKGQLANHLRPLGDGLATLVKNLGKRWDLGVEPVGFRPAMFPRNCHTRGMDHVRLYPTPLAPARSRRGRPRRQPQSA